MMGGYEWEGGCMEGLKLTTFFLVSCVNFPIQTNHEWNSYDNYLAVSSILCIISLW